MLIIHQICSLDMFIRHSTSYVFHHSTSNIYFWNHISRYQIWLGPVENLFYYGLFWFKAKYYSDTLDSFIIVLHAKNIWSLKQLCVAGVEVHVYIMYMEVSFVFLFSFAHCIPTAEVPDGCTAFKMSQNKRIKQWFAFHI